MSLFDRQPVLRSDLLTLRPLGPEDWGALYRIACDPALWEQHPSKDRGDEPVFRRWFADALDSGGALVAEDNLTGEVIGTSRYVQRSQDDVEIGWTFIARSRWGGRWNSEMKRLMVRHAFEAVPTVTFTVHESNLRSQRAVERLGAVRTGTIVDERGRGTNVVFRLERPQVALAPAQG